MLQCAKLLRCANQPSSKCFGLSYKHWLKTDQNWLLKLVSIEHYIFLPTLFFQNLVISTTNISCLTLGRGVLSHHISCSNQGNVPNVMTMGSWSEMQMT